MAFQQGLSGLNAAARNLDVIGHNVANANTVGFKKEKMEFADVYARSLIGADDLQIGQGVKVSRVSRLFTQGNVNLTGNPLDIAINGSGFFRLANEDGGEVSYSRNGQFHTDKDGYIISSSGQHLTGYGVDASGQINVGLLTNLKVPFDDLAPLATVNANFNINLDSGASIPTATPFSPTESNTFNHSVSVQVYDGTGLAHMLTTYYVRTASGWDVYALADGTAPTGGNPISTLTFNGNGQMTAPSPAEVPVSFPASMNLSLAKIDFSGTTQYGGGYNENQVSQDGYTTGHSASFSVSTDGTLVARYTNGRTSLLGQICLSSFRAPEGLQSLGDNLWVETSNSGVPQMGLPGVGLFGFLQPSAVEQSNVDLGAELVNMIVAQRTYQANAQTIKTEDSILQTLVNLR